MQLRAPEGDASCALLSAFVPTLQTGRFEGRDPRQPLPQSGQRGQPPGRR